MKRSLLKALSCFIKLSTGALFISSQNNFNIANIYKLAVGRGFYDNLQLVRALTVKTRALFPTILTQRIYFYKRTLQRVEQLLRMSGINQSHSGSADLPP